VERRNGHIVVKDLLWIPDGIYCCGCIHLTTPVEDGDGCQTGYCELIDVYDYPLLWDGCKMCGIFEEMTVEEEEYWVKREKEMLDILSKDGIILA
jgi:hypothetical protein